VWFTDDGVQWREIATELGPVSKVEHYTRLLPDHAPEQSTSPRPHA
jgi:hypothetical protein